MGDVIPVPDEGANAEARQTIQGRGEQRRGVATVEDDEEKEEEEEFHV